MKSIVVAAVAAFSAVAASGDAPGATEAKGAAARRCGATCRPDNSFFTTGGLFTGVNYWASHAGMYMWRRWSAETVEKDFAALEAYGVDTLRVFPLWPDFQPLTRMIGTISPLTEGVLQNDLPLANPAGVDEEMMRRFRFMCDAAERHGMKLVVGLITGWMSGRRFVPPALEDKNPITNQESVKWQVRFVHHFVREMRDHPAIAAWDLGNECNTLGGSRDELWGWMNAIASAIRLEDPARPVVSGMHGISSDRSSAWNAYSQGELLDVLTTHPYPLFTPDCSREPFDTMRNELHGTAESLYYAGLSGRPCFIEEAGNLSANIASDARTAASVRCAMLNAWAHGLGGYVWWCAFDQTHLDFPPYTGSALERGLGILRADYSPKPVAGAMKELRSFLDGFQYAKLPPRRVDAVVVVSEMENCWAQAFGAFMLAKEAGFDVAFAPAERELPESRLYMMLSGANDHSYTQTAWLRLLAKARAGATLFVSKGNGFMLSDFLETTGTEIEFMHRGGESRTFELAAYPGRSITVGDDMKTRWTAHTSEVLAKDAAGRPVMTSKRLGEGRIVAFNGPLEFDAAKKGDGFTGDVPNPRYLVYREVARLAGVKRLVEKADSPLVGLTEHPLGDGRSIVVAVNYEPRPVKCAVSVAGAVGRTWRGAATAGEISIGANDAAVFEVAAPGAGAK